MGLALAANDGLDCRCRRFACQGPKQRFSGKIFSKDFHVVWPPRVVRVEMTPGKCKMQEAGKRLESTNFLFFSFSSYGMQEE